MAVRSSRVHALEGRAAEAGGGYVAGIYRRGRTYWARAQRGGREFRTSLKTTDRRLAESRYRTWFDELTARAWGERPRRLFAEAATRFAGEHVTTLKPSSARRYQISLHWLAEHFAGKFLDQITRELLADFEAWRRAMNAQPPTIRRDLACLSSMLTSCEDWDWIKEGSNPVPSFLKRRARRGLKEAPPRTRYLAPDEETALLSAATPAVRGAIAVAIDTGLRREEQFSLTWAQVDFARRVITTTKRTKNGRPRSVPLPERTAQVLAQLRAQKTIASVHVFRHEDGQRLVNMEKGMKGAVRRAKLVDVRWHDLRRTAGCRWLQSGRSMEEVCILLGHSSVTVTEKHYAFLKGEDVAADVAQFPAHGRADSAKMKRDRKRLGNGRSGL
jgi:integrase